MNRLEFIFSAVNTIASRKQSPMIECLLAQTVLLEIEATKQELCMKAAVAGSSGSLQLVAPTEVLRQCA